MKKPLLLTTPMTSLPISKQPLSRLATALLLLSVVGMNTARAEESDTPTLTLSGFGTVGIAHSSERDADFTNSPFLKRIGAGASSASSADVDTVLGAQITANLTPDVSAVLQVISQLDINGSYSPKVEWANVKYQFTPDFNVRIGRTAMATQLVSDYRYVGYSTPWLRAPVDLYGLIPLTSNDGIDASYRFRMGDASSTFLVNYGNSEVENPNNVAPTTIKRAVGIFNTTEIGRTTLHVAYQEADLSFPRLYALASGFRQFGTAGGGNCRQVPCQRQSLEALSHRCHVRRRGLVCHDRTEQGPLAFICGKSHELVCERRLSHRGIHPLHHLL